MGARAIALGLLYGWAGRCACRPDRLAAALMAAGLWLAASVPSAAQAPKAEGFQTAAPFAILMEADTGAVLFAKNADELMYPSSMAKLMTAEVVFRALREQRLKLDDEVTVSVDAWRRGGAPSGGSTMYAAVNSRVRVEDLIRGMIIHSGNDACIALAEAMNGNEPAFARVMTQRARELGLPKAVFTNSTGLPDPEMKITPRELALLARHLIETYPDLYKIYSETDFLWNKIRQRNRNPLLAMNIGADGLKTGYTKDAGYGLVASAVQDGLRLILVVNGLTSERDRANEARKLLEWGFRDFESRLLFAEGQTVGEAQLFGGEKGRVALVGARPIRLMLPRATQEKITARIVYSGPIPAPVEKGQPIGQLKVWRGDSLTLEMPLQAGESVGQGTMTQRALDAATELIIGLFRSAAARI
jgi:D-alanyl-D-alanine carboxypeptidase (penicillin-binding protein 5/6)